MTDTVAQLIHHTAITKKLVVKKLENNYTMYTLVVVYKTVIIDIIISNF